VYIQLTGVCLLWIITLPLRQHSLTQLRGQVEGKANKASVVQALEGKASKKKTIKLVSELETRWRQKLETAAGVDRLWAASSVPEPPMAVTEVGKQVTELSSSVAALDAKFSHCVRHLQGMWVANCLVVLPSVSCRR
jgi:hypothetical protein